MGNELDWKKCWVQKVAISSTKSSLRPVPGRVLQGSILWPIYFNIFINDLENGTEHYLSAFADDTKLGGMAGIPDVSAIQRDLEGLEQWASGNLMNLFNGKCKAMPDTHCGVKAWNILHEERMRELGLFRVKKGRLRGILSILINTTWWKKLRRTEMDSAQQCPLKGVKGNVHQVKHRKFHLNIKKKYIYIYVLVFFEMWGWMVTHWHRLSREAMESLSLQITQNLTGHSPEQPALRTLLWARDWTRRYPEILSQLFRDSVKIFDHLWFRRAEMSVLLWMCHIHCPKFYSYKRKNKFT